jgi:N-acetylmuramoyl-L-alanine amidase
MRTIKNIVIHCSASPNGDAAVDRGVINRWHLEKGWAGIGYHYVIEVDGRVAPGRPESAIGAHVAGENASSIGICMVGTDRFSEAQWESLRDLVLELTERYLPAPAVWGHRDFSPDRDGDGVIEAWEHFKLCPGFDVSEWRLSGMDPQWNIDHLRPPMSVGKEVA